MSASDNTGAQGRLAPFNTAYARCGCLQRRWQVPSRSAFSYTTSVVSRCQRTAACAPHLVRKGSEQPLGQERRVSVQEVGQRVLHALSQVRLHRAGSSRSAAQAGARGAAAESARARCRSACACSPCFDPGSAQEGRGCVLCWSKEHGAVRMFQKSYALETYGTTASPRTACATAHWAGGRGEPLPPSGLARAVQAPSFSRCVRAKQPSGSQRVSRHGRHGACACAGSTAPATGPAACRRGFARAGGA